MTRPHAALVATLFLALLLCGPPARAHDLGVMEVRLTEARPNHYALAVTVPAPLAGGIAVPILPAGCGWTDDARSRIHPSETIFTFACPSGLGGGDTLLLPWPRDGAVVTARWADGSSATRFFSHRNGVIALPAGELGAAAPPQSAGRWFLLGIEHILTGIDHLLFVFALVLLVHGLGPLLRTVTAFTLAHSLTLALATLGWVRLPPAPVEALIAASIVLVAAEALRPAATRRPWRVAFAFGLLHGFGFAGALGVLGVPQGQVPLALVFFNLGVEAGQIGFLALVLPLLALARHHGPWPSWARAAPAYAIGTIAMLWFFERLVAVVGA